MTDYNKWKVTDLKLELKKRGLLQTGVKSLLVARLEEAEHKDGFESEATIQPDSSNSNAPSTTANSPEANPQALSAQPETSPEAQIQSDSTVNDLPHQDMITEKYNHTSSPSKDQDDEQNDSNLPRAIEEADISMVDAPISQPSIEETSDDRQKRKRASKSPISHASETSPKRLRTEEDTLVKNGTTDWNDKNSVESHENDSEQKRNIESDRKYAGSPNTAPDKPNVDINKNTPKDVGNEERTSTIETHDTVTADPPQNQEDSINPEQNDSSNNTRRDSRFKGLFNGGEKSNDLDSNYDDQKPERSVTPAIHPATAALYIRDMQRPLSPQQFRFHLSTLAAPPGQEPDPDLILSFYLDPIRTHAFISFKSVSAASRVRSALHSRIWPDERNRKPLWVDFVPEEKIEDWITQEQESNTGGRSMAKKWEICYDIGEDRQIIASLQEASNVPLPAQHQNSTTTQNSSNQVPLGPRSGIDGAPSGPRAYYPRAQLAPVDIGGSKLNELFNSTVTKPLLYWKPVSRELANKRLDRIEDSYSAEVKAGGRVMGDPHRYTFEEGDILVDRGVELVPGLRPPPGYRAPRPGGDRGGLSGWGRGGRYRGRGGGYRGIPSDKYGYNESRGPRDYGRY
ncbi:hypothetical protein HI914_04173 [Erysiphe necator]|uniref:Putative sap domain-containing protein n=1 Tax=Uncinula necator TaxID=52586 RepID=A0A0B1NWD6_UNCNE|nr:hypothetical protein HI914_04173 [Erysiphe necator]KHJ30268.1 putative sap domain-containing protein [Erysiphe necator]